MGFTNNYLVKINIQLPYGTSSLPSNAIPSNTEVFNGGKVVNTGGTEYLRVFQLIPGPGNGSSILFLSSDTTPPSPEDYSDSVNRVAAFTFDDYAYRNGNLVRQPGKTTLTMTYANSTDAPVTVAKIGLTHSNNTVYYYNNGVKSASSQNLLMATELLPEPVVVQPGETASFSLTLDYTKLIAKASAN